MKRPQPDVGEKVVGQYIAKMGKLSRFIRDWGTTTVNGVEVLNYKQEYYPDISPSAEKAFKALGIYSSLVNQKMKGVESAWVYLNYNKEGLPTYEESILASNITKAIIDSPTIKLIVGPQIPPASLSSISITSLVAPPLTSGLDVDGNVIDQTLLYNQLVSIYDTIWDQGYVINGFSGDRYQNLLARYLLRKGQTSVAFSFVKAKKSYQYFDVPYTVSRYDRVTESYIHTTEYKAVYSVAYEFEFVMNESVVTSADTLVTNIVADGQADILVKYINNYYTMKALLSDDYDDNYDTVKSPSYNPLLWVVDTSTNSTKGYLRLDALTGTSITIDDKLELIRKSLDSGYREKEVEVWEKLLVVIIAVVAFYFAGPAGGAWTSGASLTAIAGAVTVAGLAAAVLTYAANHLGYEGIAMAGSQFLKQVSPLLTIASIIAIVGNIYSMGTGGKGAATSITSQQVIDKTKEYIVDYVKKYITDINLNSAIELANKFIDFYTSREKNDIQKKIDRAETEIAKYKESEEQTKTRHLWMDMAKSESQMLSKDWSVYADKYDRPYEPWSTKYHTGNIQATTVNAIWTTDKDAIRL